MFDDAGRVFFAALHAAALARYGPGHDCTVALAAAARSPEAVAVACAEAAVRGLPEAEQTALMGAAHRSLRGDRAAWLAVWPGGARRQ